VNGYDACRAIRAMPRAGRIVIAALTGWDRRRIAASRVLRFDVYPVVDIGSLMHVIELDPASDGRRGKNRDEDVK
jgi:hypothetical protein